MMHQSKHILDTLIFLYQTPAPACPGTYIFYMLRFLKRVILSAAKNLYRSVILSECEGSYNNKNFGEYYDCK